MSQFSFNDFEAVRVDSNGNASANRSQKVGFFKLANDSDEAIVRFNVSVPSDMKFATVHTIQADGKWMKVSCKNAYGTTGACPLCEAAASGAKDISKALSKVYLQLLEYVPQGDGSYVAIPMVWERPAGFAREIANSFKDYGDLRNVLFKVRRNGKAGDMKTTYSLNFAPPTVYKDEVFKADFSAFENFRLDKHSYWEKSEEEIAYFLNNGAFPEVAKAEAPVASQPAYTAPAQPAYTTPAATPVEPAPSATTIATDRPARSWNF